MMNQSGHKTEESRFVRDMEFSQPTRWFHWIRAFCIFALIVTGFYLAYPFLAPSIVPEPTKFMYGLFRSWHEMIGFALISVSLFRVYLFIFDTRGSRFETASFKDLFSLRSWIAQLKNYLFMGTHPHMHGAYNPLQLAAYLFLMALIAVISVTGIILYYNVYHEGLGGVLAALFKPAEALFGGLATVRQIHHITTWLFIIFIPVHVYMATWNSVRYPNGAIDSIFSGYRYHEKEGE